MSGDNKKKFVDRLQFLGIIGPFVVLLTLFAALLKGSTQGWYLFFSTLIGLPLIWKWGLKGFLITIAALALFYFGMLTFFPFPDRLWQMGASFSLSLGLFTTYLGFEEIKMMMIDLQIESQSRLDNLIELDDKFNRSKKDWDLSENEYKLQVQDKDRIIEKLSDEADVLEKSISTMESDLIETQTINEKYIEELEQKALEISKIEVEIFKNKQEIEEVNQQLSISQTDREKAIAEENGNLLLKISNLQNQLFEMEEKLEEQTEFERNLSKEADEKELNMRKMEETLREKLALIYELQEKMTLQEINRAKQESEIASVNQIMIDKEHEIITYKTEIKECDRKINDLTQKNRDLEQDLQLLRKNIENQKESIRLLEKKSEERSLELEKLHENKNRIVGSKDKELENLYQDLEEKGQQLNQFIQRSNETDQTIKMYEEQLLESREILEETKNHHFKELTKLNDARFALFQANMDKERLRAQLVINNNNELPIQTEKRDKHWLLQIESLLKQNKLRKIDIEQLPKDLTSEIVTLNQTKAMYKQLRKQFEEKNKYLDEAREKLFKAETQLERLNKEREQQSSEESKFENDLEKSLFIKEQEISIVEEEIKALNEIIIRLLKELEEAKSLQS